MKVKLSSKDKLLKIVEGKYKYHMSQNSMVSVYSNAYVGFSKGSINSICQIIDDHHYSYDDVLKLSDEEADSLLRPKQSIVHNSKQLPDFKSIHHNLLKDKRMTLFFLWRMYCKENSNPYSYGRYCELYRKWCKKNKKACVLVMNEPPGENMYVDWFGDTLDYCFDGENMETVHFFSASLGMSEMPYVEGFLNEQLPNYIKGHIHALEYYGGVPRFAVPDNTRCATLKNYKHDIVLNKVYEDMQEHYGYVVLPARPKAPTDKNDVENTVGWFERQMLMEIKDKTYSSLEELNQDIFRITEELADLPYQKKNGTRAMWFNEYDKPLLSPLPTAKFEVYDYCLAKVPDNYHVNIQNDKSHYYSVPYEYNGQSLIGQSVIIKYSFDNVLIYDVNSNLLAKHKRSYTKYTYYETIDEHMPTEHKIVKDLKTKDSNWYLKMGHIIGENTEKAIQAILLSKKHPEQSYRACMGIISYHLNHIYTDQDIEIVCKEALKLNSITYTFISRRLKELNKKTETHENIRGADEFY